MLYGKIYYAEETFDSGGRYNRDLDFFQISGVTVFAVYYRFNHSFYSETPYKFAELKTWRKQKNSQCGIFDGDYRFFFICHIFGSKQDTYRDKGTSDFCKR